MIDPHLIRIAFYSGSDGPRVMLFGPLEATFKLLQNCFYDLAGCEKTISFQLHNMLWVCATGGIKLKLTSLKCETELLKTDLNLGIRMIQLSPPIFEWTQQYFEWEYLGKLTQGLLDSKKPCHQYLSINPRDDALVVVSKGEYTDDLLEP